MLFKKSKKKNKKLIARLRMRLVQKIMVSVSIHKKNTRLIKSAHDALETSYKQNGFRGKLRAFKKRLSFSRKKSRDKWSSG